MVPNLLIPVQTIATSLVNNSQHCLMLHVASVCTPCCMLLGVAAQSLTPVKLFQPTTPNISFVPWSPKRSATMLETVAQLFQQCWGHARHYTWSPYKVLWIVSFPLCTAGPNNVGSCCVRLHVALRSVHKSMTIILMMVQSSFHSELTDSHTFGGGNLTAGSLKLFKLRVGGTWIS